MNAIELRKKSEEELKSELHELLKEQFKLRMQKGMSETPKTHRFKQVRQDIARVKTVLNETTEL